MTEQSWAKTFQAIASANPPSSRTNWKQEWFNILNVQFPNYPRPRAQAVRFEIASGCHYTPDVFVTSWPQECGPSMPTAWETKGRRAWDDAIVKLKVAAREYPDIRWILVWKENGQWREQEIKP